MERIKQTQDKEEKEEERTLGKYIWETTGESETWETRIAQPQIGSFTERMYKHKVEFLGKSHYPMNGLFVCESLKRCREQHNSHRSNKKKQKNNKSYMWMTKEKVITVKTETDGRR